MEGKWIHILVVDLGMMQDNLDPWILAGLKDKVDIQDCFLVEALEDNQHLIRFQEHILEQHYLRDIQG